MAYSANSSSLFDTKMALRPPTISHLSASRQRWAASGFSTHGNEMCGTPSEILDTLDLPAGGDRNAGVLRRHRSGLPLVEAPVECIAARHDESEVTSSSRRKRSRRSMVDPGWEQHATTSQPPTQLEHLLQESSGRVLESAQRTVLAKRVKLP